MLAPELDQHGPERRTSRRFFGRTQGRRPVAHAHQHEAVGIEAEFDQARGMDFAHFQHRKILAHPDDGFRARRSHDEGERDGAGGGRIAHCLRIDFMQRAQRQAYALRAIEGRIDLRNAKRERPPRAQRILALDRSETVSQLLDFKCSGHLFQLWFQNLVLVLFRTL